MIEKADIAFIILSCDKFKITWKPCIDHFVNAWPNCPYPIYLLNNFISSDDDRVKDLFVGEDLNWSDSLRKGLLKIEEKRVFFIYDDSFITFFNSIQVEEIFEIAIKDDLESVTLRKNPFDNGIKYNKLMHKLNPSTKYRNALFLNLFDKEVLLGIIKSGESAWQFEKDGNERSTHVNFYSVKSTNLTSYHHGIVKGKWLPNTKKYLLRKGYNFSDNYFETHGQLRILGMNFYAKIFFLLNKILHSFKMLK